MSRCLGDLMGHADAGCSAEPEVSERQIEAEDHVLLVCSDGVWEFIDGESDVSAKRNAFVMLCNSDQERAVQYQLSVIDSISSMGDIIQLVMLELIRKVVRSNPLEKSKYVRCILTR